MALVMGAMFLVTLLGAAAVQATIGDTHLTFNDSTQKQAYAAAEAGIQQYLFDLDQNNQYWTLCVPSPANGINLAGSTANYRTVPGSSNATYAIELMPANSSSACSTSDPLGTMITTSGAGAGSLRIRSTGFAGPDTSRTSRTIVAQLRESNFLDNVWFTQYETNDPSVQLLNAGCTPANCPGTSWSAALAKAESQCGQYYRDGRTSQPFYGTTLCVEIVFLTGEAIKGPMYTNDEFKICGSPTFGRSPSDMIRIGAPWPGESIQGDSYCTNSVNNVGTVKNNAPNFPIPADDSALRTQASKNGALFTGPTCITLNGNGYSSAQPPSGSSCLDSGLTWTSHSWPANGVIYVQKPSGGNCSQIYDYTNPVYTTTIDNAGCGIAYVQGTYSSPLTIGTADDLVVMGNTKATSLAGTAMLGLVANGFVRVYHTCTAGTYGLEIDAAILSVQHSFIVDHYTCGSSLGNLNVIGSIAQEFRGAVGSGGAPYLKNYVYDDRLKYEEPPDFLDPVSAAWNVVRQNECTPTSGATPNPC